jgi:hypothetical protein
MATRSRTTFQKRQKELARQERQRAKVARRAERKLTKPPAGSGPEIAPFEDDMGPPLEEDLLDGTEETAEGPDGTPGASRTGE